MVFADQVFHVFALVPFTLLFAYDYIISRMEMFFTSRQIIYLYLYELYAQKERLKLFLIKNNHY